MAPSNWRECTQGTVYKAQVELGNLQVLVKLPGPGSIWRHHQSST